MVKVRDCNRASSSRSPCLSWRSTIAAARPSSSGVDGAGGVSGGMVVGQSPVSQQAAADALPLRDAFAVLFFASVGMLFDPIVRRA